MELAVGMVQGEELALSFRPLLKPNDQDSPP